MSNQKVSPLFCPTDKASIFFLRRKEPASPYYILKRRMSKATRLVGAGDSHKLPFHFSYQNKLEFFSASYFLGVHFNARGSGNYGIRMAYRIEEPPNP